jgi:hypothetical protein
MLQVCPIKPVVLPLCKGCSIPSEQEYREESKQNTTIQTFLNACVWVYAQLCIIVSLVKALLNFKISMLKGFNINMWSNYENLLKLWLFQSSFFSKRKRSSQKSRHLTNLHTMTLWKETCLQELILLSLYIYGYCLWNFMFVNKQYTQKSLK